MSLNVGVAIAQRCLAILALHFIPFAKWPLHRSIDEGEMRSILQDMRFEQEDSIIGNLFLVPTIPACEVEPWVEPPLYATLGIDMALRH